MDLTSTALPNIMFIIGVIAIGIGLGIEFKIVEIKSDLGKSGRIGVISLGVILIITSIFLYTRPGLTAATGQPTAAPASPEVLTVAPTSVVEAASPPAEAATAAPPTLAVPTVEVATPPPANPLADLQNLLASGIADGRVGRGKEAEELSKKLQAVSEALAKGDSKRARDQLRSLQKELQTGADKGSMDGQFAQAALQLIELIAVQYGLDLAEGK
jgi:hypothetical protein